MSKILITGGAGFIGSHLSRQLLSSGHDVLIIDDLSTGKKSNIPSQACFIKKDICEADLSSTLAGKNIDAIVHLAGQTTVPHSMKDPILDERLNIFATLNILEAARQNNIPRLIFSSTAAVYGDNENLPLTESLPSLPLSFYGLSKITAEEYIRQYGNSFGLEYIIFRFSNVYGERQNCTGEGGVISIFAQKFVQNMPLTIFGDGRQTRDFIYAGDIAKAIEKALTTPKINSIYNLSTETKTDLLTLISLFKEITGKKIPINYAPKRAKDIYNSVLSNKKARTALNWQPQMNIKIGLQKVYNSLI